MSYTTTSLEALVKQNKQNIKLRQFRRQYRQLCELHDNELHMVNKYKELKDPDQARWHMAKEEAYARAISLFQPLLRP